MLEWLVARDTDVFVFLNTRLANPVFDFIMPIATNDWFLRAVLAAIIIAMLIFGKKPGRIAAIFCLATVALSDLLSAQVVKPLVARVRPCHVIESVHLLVNCSQGLSFPSSHAANSFSLALFLSGIYPRLRWLLYSFAMIVSFSRIAVGVHYPLDVLFGALTGVLAALLIAAVYRWVVRKYKLAPGRS
jgi:membrane-associated phospholipid phosphatase